MPGARVSVRHIDYYEVSVLKSQQKCASRKKGKRRIAYVPIRFTFAIIITVLEVLAIIGVVVALCLNLRYFYALATLTEIYCVLKIIASDDNPDYKVPWLLFVLILPVVGFMLYFIFASRRIRKKDYQKIQQIKKAGYERDENTLSELRELSVRAYMQAKNICSASDSALFKEQSARYFSSGEQLTESMLEDISRAKSFIYMEYFIIKKGSLWNRILSVLQQKALSGVDVKLVYDDIGCMTKLPGNYYKRLNKLGIQAIPFSMLRGSADSRFNNRSHRKITVIDGVIGYTGGINLADEYVNEQSPFGYWKDCGLRLEGDCVWELTRLFTFDYALNFKKSPTFSAPLYPKSQLEEKGGYILPFGDGPKPLYQRRVSKSAIQNLLSVATRYVYITTPYLIIDNDLCQDIENTALKGVDVRIVVPGVADKKMVNQMTKSFYKRLMEAGVKIYEYQPGFIHAKTYVCDDAYAIIGTVNLDYRSLVHHFENSVWMYKCECIKEVKADVIKAIESSREVTRDKLKVNLFTRIFRSFARIFAPLM